MIDKPNIITIKSLLSTYPNDISAAPVYREALQKESKSDSVFGLPNTAVELLAKVMHKQLLLFKKDINNKTFPVCFDEYIITLYSIAGLGYIAASGIRKQKDLFRYYYKSIVKSFVKHGDFGDNPTPRALDAISKNVPQMINIALVAFNLIDYPHYFKVFKNAVKTLEKSLEMFEKEDRNIKEAKKIFRMIFC